MSNLFNFQPKSLDYYSDLTSGGQYTVSLNQDEACVALKVYDYGVNTLNENEVQILHSLMSRLKSEIWP